MFTLQHTGAARSTAAEALSIYGLTPCFPLSHVAYNSCPSPPISEISFFFKGQSKMKKLSLIRAALQAIMVTRCNYFGQWFYFFNRIVYVN